MSEKLGADLHWLFQVGKAGRESLETTTHVCSNKWWGAERLQEVGFRMLLVDLRVDLQSPTVDKPMLLTGKVIGPSSPVLTSLTIYSSFPGSQTEAFPGSGAEGCFF